MQFRRMGRTGLKVSAVCLGSMQFGWTCDEDESFRIMDRSVELGINFIDTADVYSRWAEGNDGGVSERIIGEWMRRSGIDRHELVIATKVRGQMGQGPNDQGLSRKHVMHAVEESLDRLGTDYIDLYQVHSPDDETPLDETLETLDQLVSSGLVNYIGASNYRAWLLMKSLWRSDVKGLARFDCLQPNYSLVNRSDFERELQEVCLDQGVGVISYSPLGAGFLTGKYRPGSPLPDSVRAGRIQEQYMNEQGFGLLGVMDQIAASHGATVTQVALAWNVANPAVTSAIVGANSVSQLDDIVPGAELTLTDEEKAALDAASAWA